MGDNIPNSMLTKQSAAHNTAVICMAASRSPHEHALKWNQGEMAHHILGYKYRDDAQCGTNTEQQ